MLYKIDHSDTQWFLKASYSLTAQWLPVSMLLYKYLMLLTWHMRGGSFWLNKRKSILAFIEVRFAESGQIWRKDRVKGQKVNSCWKGQVTRYRCSMLPGSSWCILGRAHHVSPCMCFLTFELRPLVVFFFLLFVIKTHIHLWKNQWSSLTQEIEVEICVTQIIVVSASSRQVSFSHTAFFLLFPTHSVTHAQTVAYLKPLSHMRTLTRAHAVNLIFTSFCILCHWALLAPPTW